MKTMRVTTDTAATQLIQDWPEPARESAQLVIDTYGEPSEATGTQLTWYDAGPWKRVVAQRAFWEHRFPAPHTDSVETFLDYQVPVAKVSDLAAFDGSVMVERTTGEVSARCHDEQANSLALNLMHDIVAGDKTVQEARDYYALEFLDARRKRPTPYMDGLRFQTSTGPATDPDVAVLTEEQLRQAVEEGTRA